MINAGRYHGTSGNAGKPERSWRNEIYSGSGGKSPGLFEKKTVPFSGSISLENVTVDEIRVGSILEQIVRGGDFLKGEGDFIPKIGEGSAEIDVRFIMIVHVIPSF